MSEAAPTKTEIRQLLANWLDFDNSTEDSSAPIQSNGTIFQNYQTLHNTTYGLQGLSNSLATKLQSASDNLASLLTAASNQAAGVQTLINRTASGGGGSGFAFDIDNELNSMSLNLIALQGQVGTIDNYLGLFVAQFPTADAARLATLRVALENYLNTQLGNGFAAADVNRDLILDRIDGIAGPDNTAVLAAIDQKGNDVITNVVSNRTAELAHFNSLAGQAVTDLNDTIAAIAGITADTIAELDAVRDELRTQADDLAAAIPPQLADLRTSIDADNGVRIGDQAAADDTARQAAADAVIAAINFYTASRANSLEAAHLVTQAKAADLQQNIFAVPALVKQDADAQTAYILANLPTGGSGDLTAVRDYIVSQGEAQRDYVVSQGESQRDFVAYKVDTVSTTADQILNIVGGLSDQLGHNSPGNLLAEEYFNGPFTMEHEGDYYEILIDALPPGRPHIPIGDEEYLPHAAWCAFKHGQSFERGPLLEFTHNTVQRGNLMPSGLHVHCKPGTTGVIRAYEFQQA